MTAKCLLSPWPSAPWGHQSPCGCCHISAWYRRPSRRVKADLKRLEDGDGGGRMSEGRRKGIPHLSSTLVSHICVIWCSSKTRLYVNMYAHKCWFNLHLYIHIIFIFMQQEHTVAVCHDTSNPSHADPADLTAVWLQKLCCVNLIGLKSDFYHGSLIKSGCVDRGG